MSATPAESITLNITTWSLKVGETLDLKATVLPETATDKSVTWKSSDETVATIDEAGRVVAIAIGQATITATASNGIYANCEIKALENLGIDTILSDTEKGIMVFNLRGFIVSDNLENLSQGIYIVREGSKARVVLVK